MPITCDRASSECVGGFKDSLGQWLNPTISLFCSSHPIFTFVFILIISFKSWVAEDTVEKLSSSQCIRQWQVTLRRALFHFPRELCGKRPVIVLLNFGALQLLHPPDFDEELCEIFVHFVPNPFLYAVPEFVIAVLSPQPIYGFQVIFRDELHLREEDVAPLLRRFPCQDYQKAAGLLVGLPEVLGGQMLAEELDGNVLGGGGVGGSGSGEGGGGDGESSGVGQKRRGGGRGGWFEEEGVVCGGGGGSAVYGVATPERMVVVVYRVKSIGGH